MVYTYMVHTYMVYTYVYIQQFMRAFLKKGRFSLSPLCAAALLCCVGDCVLLVLVLLLTAIKNDNLSTFIDI